MVAYLTKKLITDPRAAGADSDTIPFTVRGGKLQEDPTPGIAVLFQSGDALDESHVDGEYNTHGREPFGRVYDEIGGNMMWIHRYTIVISAFYTGKNFGLKTANDIREKAQEKASMVLGRVEHAIVKLDRDTSSEAEAVRAINDEFGEIYLWTELVASPVQESGGPPSDFIWKWRVQIRVITEKTG